ncbi:hypothetical protein B0H14DRAFT_3468787 [Mycena olivaceomarginata]|nr:hypothetical protein B0H14DRAFT_3468787 [Mycena olivaceomarginata]
MAEAPPKPLYLFLLNPHADIRYDRSSVEIPAACDSYYWSFEPDGSHRVLDEALEEILPPRVLFHPRVLGHRWLQSDYRLVTEFQLTEACDTGSTGLARKLGYPLAIPHDKPTPIHLHPDEYGPKLEDLPKRSCYCHGCEQIEDSAHVNLHPTAS